MKPCELPWKPIAKAPKDDTQILCWCPPAHELPELYAVTTWHPDAGHFCCELRNPEFFIELMPPVARKGDNNKEK